MAIRIFNNTASVNAQRILGVNNNRLAQSIERISSGIRINRGPMTLPASQSLKDCALIYVP